MEQHRHPAGNSHLHRRDRDRLATGQLRITRGRHREHHLCRLLLRTQWALRGRRRLLRDSGVTNAPLTALQNGVDGGNGVYRYGAGGGFPNSTFSSTNYWVDLVFNPSGADTTKPTVTDRQPAAGATGVPVTTNVSATFSEPVQAVDHHDDAERRQRGCRRSTSYDSATRTVTLTPNANLSPSTDYTVNLSGARDSADNQMDPVTWTFTTAAAATGCPCTIWPNTTVPATPAAADNLGGRSWASSSAPARLVSSPASGSTRAPATPAPTWAHCGDRTGTKLASVTFTGETATGGSRPPSAPRCRSPRIPPTSRPTTRRSAGTR